MVHTGEVKVSQLSDVAESWTETSGSEAIMTDVERQQRVGVVEHVIGRTAHQPVAVYVEHLS